MRKQIIIALASALLAGAPFALAQYIPKGGSSGGGGSSNCILNSSPSDVLFNSSGTCAGNNIFTYDGISTVTIGNASTNGVLSGSGSSDLDVITPNGSTPGALQILAGNATPSGNGAAVIIDGGAGAGGGSGGNVGLNAGSGSPNGVIQLGIIGGGVTIGNTPADQGNGTLNTEVGYWTGGNFLASPSAVSTQFVPLVEVFPNDTSGTAAGKIVKINSSGKVLTVGTADTTDGIGICVASLPNSTQCSTSGNASIAYAGQVSCFFDGTAADGDWVIISTSVAGDCSDGTSTPPSNVEILGIVKVGGVGAGLRQVTLDPLGIMAAISKGGGGGGGGAPTVCATGHNYACINIAQSWSAGQRSTPVAAVLSTSTFNFDMNTSDNFSFALVHASCPCQIANPSNLTAGQTGVLVIQQSATGSDTVTWGGNFAFPNGTPTLQTTANAEDYFSFYAESSSRIVVVPASGAYGAVQQIVNYNSAAVPTFPADTGFGVNGANSSAARNIESAYAAGAFNSSFRADGSGASPTAVQSGEEIGGANGYGLNGSTYVGPIFSFHGYAAENLAVNHQGSKACIATTPTSSTTIADSLCQQASGGVTIGSPTGGDPGAGKLNATDVQAGGISLAHGELIGIRYFTSGTAATYTPTAGTNSVIIEIVGGGGGGAGCAQPGGSDVCPNSSGGGGGYCQIRLTANFSGATYTIGGGGGAGNSSGSVGSNGSNTTFITTGGSPITYTAGGGTGGGTGGAQLTPTFGFGAAGGSVSASSGNCDLSIPGGASEPTVALGTGRLWSGNSGGSAFAKPLLGSNIFGANTSVAGTNASAYGQGGTAGIATGTGTGVAGGNGFGGVLRVQEFNFLLKRDLDPSNDNLPMFLDEVA